MGLIIVGVAACLTVAFLGWCAWDGFRRYVGVVRERTEWLAKYERGFQSNVEAMKAMEADFNRRLRPIEAAATRDALTMGAKRAQG